MGSMLLRKMSDFFFILMELIRIFTKKTTMSSRIGSCPVNLEDSISNPKRISFEFSDLHADLVECIAAKCSSMEARIRFSAVCSSWCSAALSVNSKLDYQSLSPWMMLGLNSPGSLRRGFYNPATGELFRIELPPEMEGRTNCWGSPFGWIFVRSLHSTYFLLLNPISRASIPLPRLDFFFYYHYRGPLPFPMSEAGRIRYIARVVLTASPVSADSILFLIYSKSRNLGYIRPGDSTWCSMEGECWSDVIYFKGNLYGCLTDGKVMLISGTTTDNSTQLEAVEFAAAPPNGDRHSDEKNLKYLVDLEGELCLVIRYYTDATDSLTISFPTFEFEIYKLDIYTKSWKRVLALGDKCIFVGANYSYSVVRSCSLGLRPNCIYFSDDYSLCQRRSYSVPVSLLTISDTGIYNVGNGEVAAFTIPLSVEHQEMHFASCPSLWITPTFN